METEWWVTAGPLPGGRKVAGPYGSEARAIEGRAALERETHTFWIFTTAEIGSAAVIARETGPAELAAGWAQRHGWALHPGVVYAFMAGYAAARAEREGHCRECDSGGPCEDHKPVADRIGWHCPSCGAAMPDPDMKTAPAAHG